MPQILKENLLKMEEIEEKPLKHFAQHTQNAAVFNATTQSITY